ncbi:MAG: mandelate racemase/muconate lactonizing enzyme family protein [Armatimonas sp.]
MRRKTHGPKVEKLTTYRLSTPLPEPVLWAHGRRTHREALLVKVETEGGAEGWGECGGPAALAEAAVHDLYAPHLLGQDALQTEAIWNRLYTASLPWGRRGVSIGALSGIDMALWDTKGHLRRCPGTELFGGRLREQVSLFATGLYAREEPEAGRVPRAWDEARQLLDSGFRAVNIALGRSVAADLALIRRLRERYPEATFFGDAHGAYDPTEAATVIAALEDANFAALFEPGSVPTTRLPLQAGASTQTRWDVQTENLSAWQTQLSWCGGPTEAAKIRAVAQAQGRNIQARTCHSTPVGFAAALHFVASDARVPGRAEAAPILLEKDGDADLLWTGAFTGLTLEDGVASVPWTYGWGVAVDEEALTPLTVSRRES